MSDLLDRVIVSLRAHHDLLADLVEGLDGVDGLDGGLDSPSGAAPWSVAEVLSHLGSGAELMLVPVSAATDGAALLEPGNEAVWDRWNALTPAEQAAQFVQHDTRLVERLESLSEDQRRTLRVDLGFLPEPVPLEVAAGLRLNEVAQHTWDVEVALDPAATLDEEAAELLVELYAGGLGFLLGFTANPDVLVEPVVLEAFGHGLVVEESVLLVGEPPVAPTASFVGEKESFVRLIGGRLAPARTPDDVYVSGNVSLEDLRRVFPGF